MPNDNPAAFVAIPELSIDETVLFACFQERAHQIVLAEGKKLDLLEDGFPITIRLSFDLFPNLDEGSRKTLIFNVMLATEQAQRLLSGQTKGAA